LACPSKAQGMYLDNLLSGRRERRLPVIVVVRLARLDREHAAKYERTYTDNLSPHGVRVLSTHLWRVGEQAEITPVNEESPMRGEVVYCQKRDETRFFVGLKFPLSRIPWLILQRFDGT
jgi:hypothetical protein